MGIVVGQAAPCVDTGLGLAVCAAGLLLADIAVCVIGWLDLRAKPRRKASFTGFLGRAHGIGAACAALFTALLLGLSWVLVSPPELFVKAVGADWEGYSVVVFAMFAVSSCGAMCRLMDKNAGVSR